MLGVLYLHNQIPTLTHIVHNSNNKKFAFCVGVRPAVAPAVPAPPDTLRRWTHLSGGRADSIHTATPDATRRSCLCRVWCAAVWTGRLLWTCSDFKFSVGDSPVLSGIQFTPPKRTRHRQDSFVVSGVAVWISFQDFCRPAVLVAETRSVHSDQQRSLTCIQDLLVQIKFILLDKTRHTRSSVVCSPTAMRATPYWKLVPVIKI